jgi:hypothetical protein
VAHRAKCLRLLAALEGCWPAIASPGAAGNAMTHTEADGCDILFHLDRLSETDAGMGLAMVGCACWVAGWADGPRLNRLS